MNHLIVIYANCMNRVAKGDFSLAGALARDLVNELQTQPNFARVMLTSSKTGLKIFFDLYGNPIDDRITINNVSIDIKAIDEIDSVQFKVIAFIEANRCKFPASDVLKRILSPDSKLFFVGAANQFVVPDDKLYLSACDLEQKNVYPFFSINDIKLLYSGLGQGRQGLTLLKKTSDLPRLAHKPPCMNAPFGMMYFSALNHPEIPKMISQYIALTKLQQFILLGDFQDDKSIIDHEIAYSFRNAAASINITYINSLDSVTLRNTTSCAYELVGTTGCLSTLEVMHDGKLPYYQYLSSNDNFVQSYLESVTMLLKDTPLYNSEKPHLILTLAGLLFLRKPLSSVFETELQNLLLMSNVKKRLIEVNHKIIDKANGKIAKHLLGFIGEKPHASLSKQCAYACQQLKKPFESTPPSVDKALRRAAAWGKLFELKVLLQNITPSDVNKTDSNYERTALHWALIEGKLDCARLLIKHGVNIDAQDKQGKTPLTYAVIHNNKDIAQKLVDAGASLTIQDHGGNVPVVFANSSALYEIVLPPSKHACLMM